MRKNLVVGGLWMTFNLLDAATTRLGLILGGAREANPLFDALVVRYGMGPVFVWKMAVAAISGVFLIRMAGRHPVYWQVMRALNVVFCGAVLWNLWLVTRR